MTSHNPAPQPTKAPSPVSRPAASEAGEGVVSEARLIRGLSYDEYARTDAWRWSQIKHVERSPLHAKHMRDNGGTDSAAQAQLRAVHCAVLEPDKFEFRYSVYEGKARRGKAFKAHREEHPGTEALNPREYDAIRTTADAIRNHPVVAEFMREGEAEVVVEWTDKRTGIRCIGRIDWLSKTVLFDLKTCGTTHEHEVQRLVTRNGWHGQLAHYYEGTRALGLHRDVAIVVAEMKPPHDVAVFNVPRYSGGALNAGRMLRERLMKQLRACIDSGNWPGRHAKAAELILPDWAFEETLEIGSEHKANESEEESNPWT